jgi:hypothetical protein
LRTDPEEEGEPRTGDWSSSGVVRVLDEDSGGEGDEDTVT